MHRQNEAARRIQRRTAVEADPALRGAADAAADAEGPHRRALFV